MPEIELPSLTLVIGGSRSGKSRFAERLCARWQEKHGHSVTYLATAPRLDGEMNRRIQRHRERRPASWRTVEEPLRLVETIRGLSAADGILLLDCLSLWVNNWLYTHPLQDGEGAEEWAAEQTEQLAQACLEHPAPVVIVTSEVGAGLIPPTREGRIYRDALGMMNQLLAARAEAVYAVISGIPVDLKRWEVHV